MFTLYSPFTMLSVSVMVTSSMMTISSTNWLFLWAAMELNLLSFIPIMMNSKKFQETEAAVKYFLAQALGSSLLLMSSMSLWFFFSTPNQLTPILLLMALAIKMGMAPCHLWYPSVMTSISWLPALILSTWQKLAPLVMMSFMPMSSMQPMMFTIAGLNAITGGLLGMNQSHLRTIMAYSSITHMGWMMSLIAIQKPMFTMYYFIMYSLIITPIFMIMDVKNLVSTSNTNKLISNSPMLQFALPLILLSLSGIPPLTGFIPKWMTITIMLPTNPTITIIMILGAMMNTYYYLNISFNFMLTLKFNTNSTYVMESPMKFMLLVMSASMFYMPIAFMM